MQSNNPVFRRSEEFNRSNAYGNPTYQGNGAPYQGYGAPQGNYQGYAPPAQGYDEQGRLVAPPAQTGGGRMTIDTVVQSTAITLGVVLLVATATWFLTPPIEDEAAVGTLGLAVMLGAGAAFILSLVNSFKRIVSPGLVIAFAVAEGVALGALSKLYDAIFYNSDTPGGIVLQAVVGTFAAFAGTLAAYKFFDIKVGNKFRTFVIAAMFGMVALGLMELVLSMFSSQLGLFGFSTLGLVFSVAGLVLGVLMLILDFDFIEQGIRNGLPARESWRASFGLLVSLVWIYTNLLRILAILQQD
ncbi:Bax inhibitor-1/YccA family protein [Nocardioides sp. SYSU DS0651]|uniref:Bax inhibitor-1/YccA family protein n=1 Tax=Nocardioides sp. SYSU DS0651 TaxID=3415955 RepID=UPI003F4B518F